METKTTKGNPCMIFENNRFRLNNEGVHRRTWRCTTKFCKAKIYSSPGSTDIMDADGAHNHEDNVRNLQHHILRVNCKQHGKDDVQSNAETIVYKQLFSMVDRSEILEREIYNTKRAVYNMKRKRASGEGTKRSPRSKKEKTRDGRNSYPVSIITCAVRMQVGFVFVGMTLLFRDDICPDMLASIDRFVANFSSNSVWLLSIFLLLWSG